MRMIYVVYEADVYKSYDSIIIKHMSTDKAGTKKFYDKYKASYIEDTGYNFFFAKYENEADLQSEESNILRDLDDIESTDG